MISDPVEISGYSHFFGSERGKTSTGAGRSSLKTWRITNISLRAWHLRNYGPRGLYLSSLVWNRPGVAITKRDYYWWGQRRFSFKKGKQKMKNVLKFIGLSALLMTFALVTGSVFAQTTTTGAIEGTVLDPNGAAVPGVTVTATRQGGRSMTATTNDSGVYRIVNIEPGRYSVTVGAEKGFDKFEESNVQVSLSSVTNVTVQLRPQGAAARP